jgi:hypothetical protein
MADPTIKYNLAKPDDGNTSWGEDIRGNMDKIDTALTDQDTRLTTAEGTITEHENRIDTIEANAGAAGDAESIHGRAVEIPETTDNGRVLAYDSGTNSYIWADAPTGGSTGGSTGGTTAEATAEMWDILKVENVATGIDTMNKYAPSNGVIPNTAIKHVDFTLEEETFLRLTYFLYVSIDYGDDMFWAISNDGGANFSTLTSNGTAPYTTRPSWLPDAEVLRYRATTSAWDATPQMVLFGTFPPGTYRVALARTAGEIYSVAGHNQLLLIEGRQKKTVSANSLGGVPIDVTPTAEDDGKVLTYDAATGRFILTAKA